jgi:hypothetical protein
MKKFWIVLLIALSCLLSFNGIAQQPKATVEKGNEKQERE